MNLNDRPDSFEDRLLTELKQEVVRRNQAAPIAPPRWRRGRYLAVAAAVLVAACLPAFGWGATTPAFAVEPTADGEIKVSVNRLEEPEALERALAAHGIKADVSYTPEGKSCAIGRYLEAPAPDSSAMMGAQTEEDGTWTLILSPQVVRVGETLVLESSWSEHAWSMTVGTAKGAVAPCELVNAPEEAEFPHPSAGATSNGDPVCKVSDLPAGVPTDDFVPDPSCKDE